MFVRFIEFCSVLFCSVLFCSVLFRSVPFCSVLFCSCYLVTDAVILSSFSLFSVSYQSLHAFLVLCSSSFYFSVSFSSFVVLSFIWIETRVRWVASGAVFTLRAWSEWENAFIVGLANAGRCGRLGIGDNTSRRIDNNGLAIP